MNLARWDHSYPTMYREIPVYNNDVISMFVIPNIKLFLYIFHIWWSIILHERNHTVWNLWFSYNFMTINHYFQVLLRTCLKIFITQSLSPYHSRIKKPEWKKIEKWIIYVTRKQCKSKHWTLSYSLVFLYTRTSQIIIQIFMYEQSIIFILKKHWRTYSVITIFFQELLVRKAKNKIYGSVYTTHEIIIGFK